VRKTTLIAASVLMLCAGCYPKTKDNDESGDPVRYQDRETGCMYLSTSQLNSLTPRIAADGKTHMGCSGVAK
jgi:hypothetical protein